MRPSSGLRSPASDAVGRPPEPRLLIGEEEGDAAVALAERLHAAPDDLARGGERVEIARQVALESCGEDLALEDRRGERCGLEALDGVEQGVETAPSLRHALPGGDETSEHRRGHGLDLRPQLRQ